MEPTCDKTKYLRVAASVTYDGLRGVPWFRSGLRHKFRLDDMPFGHFLPNMGTEVDGEIHYGATGRIKIDLLVDEVSRPLLQVGATFTLHDSPSQVTARGVVLGIEYDVDQPLGKESYGED